MKKTKNTSRELVRDGYLGDLPADLQGKLMEISKLIADNCYSTIKEKTYKDIADKGWAKTMLSDFLTAPKDKTHVGSVRVYKKGNRYSCMIQITGHPVNNRNDLNEELFHDFIRNVHGDIRAIVRRKYDMHLTCESEHGEHFEGFDVWTNKKVAKEIWDKFSDMRSKTVSDYEESVEAEAHSTRLTASFMDLPSGLQNTILEAVDMISESMFDGSSEPSNNDNTTLECDTSVGSTMLHERSNGGFSGSICIATFNENYHYTEEMVQKAYDECSAKFEEANPGKFLSICGKYPYLGFEIVLESNYAKYLWEYLESDEEPVYTESYNYIEKHHVDADQYISESNESLSEAEAKKTLRALCTEIIDGTKNDPDYRVTQYKANTFANIITKSILPKVADGYRKFSIQLDTYQSFFTFEFKTPAMTQDFISRFIEGRESIDGFLHRNPEIRVKMSPRIFHTMNDPDDAYRFFKAAIKYYNDSVESYANRIAKSVAKLNGEMKRLISTTKLSGIVSIPLTMLFSMSDVSMKDISYFTPDKSSMDALDKFISSIYTNYASPEKEKTKILHDIEELVNSFNESFNNKLPYSFAEEVKYFYEGVYAPQMEEYKIQFESAQVDHSWPDKAKDQSIKFMTEAKHMKKLKKIPADLVAYITIEAESIRDANDKMMIASYCISKLEIVEWYIELLEVGSEKYIVPMTKPQLERIRTQLLACYKKIMDTKIPSPDRPIVQIDYPSGYEG